ncbi:MAG: GlsB/YeaQ/YmgE family stress response membrane protein [Anaerolineae bacterium]|nr:GlsB/YeaQ/YmgE family stress response membrane protein [Anaerolineae bacterium]
MNQSVTLTFVPEQLVTWVIIGLIAGLLAGLLIRGRGLGFVSSVVVGLLGALLGGFLFTVLRIQVPPALSGGITLAWADILVAFIGAVIILLLFGGFYRRRRVLG